MQNRTIFQSPIVKNRKISPPGRQTKPKTASTKIEGCHKKCSLLPTIAETSRPLSVKSGTSATLSSNCKKPTVEKKVSDKLVTQQKPTPSSASRAVSSSPPTAVEKSLPPSVTSKTPSTLSTSSSKPPVTKKLSSQQKPIPFVPSRPSASLLRKDLKQLTAKFGEVSSTILQLATSQVPVGVRSLESLLNREVSNSLGDAINSPEFSQGFVQGTRRLLEELVNLYEGGKINPRLLQDRTREDKSFIRATSATTVCYRDRYFKELVMNVLRSMTSSGIEEEVTGQATHSEESRERIRIIRDMVRIEAGLEPEEFRELEQRLEELKRSLSKSKLEVEKATSEVDRMISQQIVQQESISNFQIPKPAREVLKACCNKPLELGCDFSKSDKSNCGNENGCCEQMSCSRSSAEDSFEKYKKILNIVGGEECFEKGNSDEVKNIRPQLKHLVHEELLRIKMKEEEILNRDREFDRNNGLGDSPKSSFESVEFKSAASNISADDDDEINEEERLSFLEALKAEIEERKIKDDDILNSAPYGCYIKVLEKIEEDEDEINYRETPEKNVSSSSVRSKTSSCSTNIPSVDLRPLVCCDESLNNIRQRSTSDLEKQPSEKSLIERVKSKWLNQEESDVNNVMAEMKDAFEIFKAVPDDVFSAFRISEDYKKETGDAAEATKFDVNSSFYLWDFTVEELANVLVNISIKINNLPEYLQELTSNDSAVQKEQAFVILSVLEKCMNVSKSVEYDATVALDEASASLPIKKFAKTFSFLSDTLSCSPGEMKSESISVLNPPKSLVETLHVLSSTEYFRNCFTSVKENLGKHTDITKNIEVVDPYDFNNQRSRGGLNLEKHSSLGDNYSGCRRKIYTYTRDIKRPEDLNKNISKFENFKGLTASVMTVQNVSDMFLFLSAVLNDVPERLKSQKILDLSPPFTFLKALDILYCEDEVDSVTDLDKKKSFASLTLQNVSDFLLTLSKTFYDVPERLKDSMVVDMKPPASLIRAITLLTSLSHFSIPESHNTEIEENINEGIISSENQESFFDAVASLASMK